MTDVAEPAERGALVTGTLYHSDSENVTGRFVPRDDHPDAQPPADAAWVDTGDPQGPLMVNATSVRPAPDLRAVRDAAQNLADAVHNAMELVPPGTARIQLPLIPRLQLPGFLSSPIAEAEEDTPNPRQVAVQVRTVPVLGEPTEVHTYSDDQGLTWQTYGQEHDFSTDRLLEVVNADGDQVASYAPGTWLHVCYAQYLDMAGTEPAQVGRD